MSKKFKNNKIKITIFIATITIILTGMFLGEYKVLANEEISIDIKNSEIKGYISLKELVKNLNGNLEKKLVGEERKYIATIHSMIKGNKYKLEFSSNKETVKIVDKEIAINYDENSEYIVPNYKNAIVEKNDDLFISSNFFKKIFSAREDKLGNIILKKDLGGIIELRLLNENSNVNNKY